MSNHQGDHWYQEPWAIFTFAVPLMTVVAGLITVYIAVQAADTPVNDDISRFGITTEADHRP